MPISWLPNILQRTACTQNVPTNVTFNLSTIKIKRRKKKNAKNAKIQKYQNCKKVQKCRKHSKMFNNLKTSKDEEEKIDIQKA